jgi:ATP-dependent Clp protease ATP-binding subunit ClpA
METQAYRVAVPLLAEADVEARQLGHPFVAPEHLLLAVAEHGRGPSRMFFERHGLTPQVLRDSVTEVLGQAPVGTAADGQRSLALRSIVALAHAVNSGRRRGLQGTAYTPEDLLLALLADDVAPGAVVGAVFERAGLTSSAARAEVTVLGLGDPAT